MAVFFMKRGIPDTTAAQLAQKLPTGTKDDPIPFVYGMEVEKDKYYSYGGVIYLCNQSMDACEVVPGAPDSQQWEEVA